MRNRLVNIFLAPFFMLSLLTFFVSVLMLGTLNKIANFLGADQHVVALRQKAVNTERE